MALAMLAVMCIPTIYSSAYLYANSDPYGNLKNIPVAIVNEDEPAFINGTSMNLGDEITEELLESGQFKFSVTDLSQATAGVTSSEYAFAIHVPDDFSASMSDLTNFDPKVAEITILTNDANSFLSHQIATEATTAIALLLNGKVSAEVLNQMLIGFNEVHDSLSEAADGAQELYTNLEKARDGAAEASEGMKELIEGVRELQSGAYQVLSGANELAEGLNELNTQTKSLPDQTRQLADGAQQVADGDAEIATIVDTARTIADTLDTLFNEEIDDLEKIIDDSSLSDDDKAALKAFLEKVRTGATQIAEALDTIDGNIDELAAGAQEVADATELLAKVAPVLASGIERLSDGANQLSAGVRELTTGISVLAQNLPELSDGIIELHEGLVQLTAGAEELSGGLREGLSEVPNPSDDERKRMMDFIASPVQFNDSDEVESIGYATGLAPFFIGLSTWVGAYILLLLLRTVSTRALVANVAGWKVALGGWIPPALFVIAQVTVLEAAIALLGVEIANPGLTWLFMVLIALTYVTILQALIMVAGKIGVFIGLVLLVIQLTTAGGTFPWETMPEAFQALHHVFPMSYAVDGLRQLMYGASMSIALMDTLILSAYLLGAAIAVLVATRFRREWLPEYLKPPILTV
jgi:putative membrane protein